MTFKEPFLTGQCSISAIDAWTEIWRQRSDVKNSLQEFLGLSDEEYQAWTLHGNAGLAQQINSDHLPEYGVVYLGWDELTDQLQKVVDAELGLGYVVTLRRQDHYYWDLNLRADQKMDAELSEKICKHLDLRDVDVKIFLDEDWIDSSHLHGLLTKLTHRKVTSSHADDNGVWIIYKDLLWSSPEFADRLLAGCENRLRREILSESYPTVDENTAAHQLFGFKEALTKLGLLDLEQWRIMPDHFADLHSEKIDMKCDKPMCRNCVWRHITGPGDGPVQSNSGKAQEEGGHRGRKRRLSAPDSIRLATIRGLQLLSAVPFIILWERDRPLFEPPR